MLNHMVLSIQKDKRHVWYTEGTQKAEQYGAYVERQCAMD